MRTLFVRTLFLLALVALARPVVAQTTPVSSETPGTPVGPPPNGTPAAGTPASPGTHAPASSAASAVGVCTISGPVLTPSDFGVPAGQPVADVSTTLLADGRIRMYAFAQGQGIRSAVSVSQDGLSLLPEVGARLADGAGMPRIVGGPVGGYRLFFT